VDLGIAGRVGVVTGASRGIGRAVAEALAAAGCRLVLSARGAEGLEETAQSLPADVVTVAGDVTDPATSDGIAAAAARWGGADILVNNAGSDSGHLPMERLADGDWERAFALHVVAPMRLCRLMVPGMATRGWGRVVNVASYTARVPEPFCAPYAAAKAALVNATRNLSRSYGPAGVTANSVLPGLTDTEGVRSGFDDAMAATGRSYEELLERMLERAPIDTGRVGTAGEVAAAVAFLCSQPAAWITGAALAVDGGTVRSAL
jgi:3-oxoacyl-[acyl-carrier protein] reductase